MGGLALPQHPAGGTSRRCQWRTGKGIIMVFLPGGPPHQDMWDIKIDAPAEIRGEFHPIQTKVPGIEICELFPRLASLADQADVHPLDRRGHGGPLRLSVPHRAAGRNQPPGGWPCAGFGPVEAARTATARRAGVCRAVAARWGTCPVGRQRPARLPRRRPCPVQLRMAKAGGHGPATASRSTGSPIAKRRLAAFDRFRTRRRRTRHDGRRRCLHPTGVRHPHLQPARRCPRHREGRPVASATATAAA